MANEITWDSVTGLTFYACRFLVNDNVYLSNPAMNEVWGTDGRDASDYAIALTESNGSGHYSVDFDYGGSIAVGVSRIVIYSQAGDAPVDSDKPVGRGEIEWNGFEEVGSLFTDALINDLNNITVADIMNANIEGSITLLQAVRGIISANLAKASGGGTTNIKMRDTEDSKNRIDMTVDSNGNRSAVTLDLT